MSWCCALSFLCAALGNIVSVLGLFFFIYSIVGMNLWGLVKEGQFLTRHANFQHVGMALLTLFRMITGAAQHLQPAQPRAGMYCGCACMC